MRNQGTEVTGFAVDLKHADQARSMVEQAIELYGRIDTLVNNAGVASAKPIWDLTEADWDAVLDVNVKGLFFALQNAARHMVAANGGSISNIASVAGRAGRPGLLHYPQGPKSACAFGKAHIGSGYGLESPPQRESARWHSLSEFAARLPDCTLDQSDGSIHNSKVQKTNPAKAEHPCNPRLATRRA